MENWNDIAIPEELGSYILEQMNEYKRLITESALERIKSLEESLEVSSERLFEFADRLVEEAKEKIREEYSAKYARKIEEKNEQILSLQNEIEEFKDTLAERVNHFLSNAKEDMKVLIEEELRLDAGELRAKRALEQIRSLVTGEENDLVIEEMRAKKLEEDIRVLQEKIGTLKERVSKGEELNERLKAKLRSYELLESVPESDKEFFKEQLLEASSPEEAELIFERIEAAVRRSRESQIEEEFTDGVFGKGGIEDFQYDDVPTLEEAKIVNPYITDRIRKLAEEA